MKILRLGACLMALGWFAGCASVKSTEQFYVATTTKIYPPKPKDAPVPILSKSLNGRYVEIGRLAFESDEGWRFLRKSMEYNARIHGADAVILNNVRQHEQWSYVWVPSQTDWVPTSTYYRGPNGRLCGGTTMVPIYRPGYMQPWLDRITAIDARMIVFKK